MLSKRVKIAVPLQRKGQNKQIKKGKKKKKKNPK